MPGRCVAMWSGPRNISTAMMRAWENRSDCHVVDEPLYAHYLSVTGLEHPARDEVLNTQDRDWRNVVASLARRPADGRIFYQKHMTHHITADVELEWLAELEHCFLIRDPDEVVSSYTAVREDCAAEDLGYVQQRRIFDHVSSLADDLPPVIDARDVLEDPEGVLRALCARMAIAFDPAMLTWPAGPRESDGVWAPYWYAAVERSTGFAPYRPRRIELSAAQRTISDACRPHYEALHALRIRSARDD